MAARYLTSDGDMLDWICHRHYGRTAGVVEAVLDANPGLADLGPVYAAGLEIVLPDVPPAQTVQTVRLWD
ncbi:tail protein X [Desulfobulbus elongatus]|uniref:tail protein X n=1 Tax=Desulfobulbus elongatus TaxID=53332 RepID=UPI0004847D4E|nr:tail protein X [Desulfobulbus elongatus]